MLLDIYFKRPIFWDLIASGLCVGSVYCCLEVKFIHVPSEERLQATVSDMCTVALTCAGFILTLVTLLISFKSSSAIDKSKNLENNKTIDLFFSSKFYYSTIDLLNSAIKALTIVALIGYALKLLLSDIHYKYLLFYSVFAIVVILLTIWRCVIILSKIVKIQNHE